MVKWTEPAQYYSVHHYDIYRRNDTNTAALTTADVVGRVGLGTTVFADVITAPDTTQAYWVKSIGWGEKSSAYSVTITCSVTYQGINAAYIQFALTFTGTHSEGKMHWNSAEGTVNVGMPGGSVELQLGQEHLLRVRNTTGTAITNGDAVYITGAQGQFPLISRALALTVPNALVQGIATEEIAHNANGFITTWGLVRDLNTSGLNEGDILLLSETAAGKYTASSPTLHPSIKTIVGFAISIHTSDGMILAHPRWVYPMMSLSDVSYDTGTETGQFLRWNTATNTFEINKLHFFETAVGTITTTASVVVGNGTSYTTIGESGQISFVGGARIQKQVDIPIANVGFGVNKPTQTYIGHFTGWAYGIGDDSSVEFHVPDDWASGTDITLLAHLYVNEDYATNSGQITFQIDYACVPSSGGETIDSPTHTGTIQFGPTAIPQSARNVLEGSVVITASNIAAEDLVGITFERIANPGAEPAPAAEPVILDIHIHYWADRLGGTNFS